MNPFAIHSVFEVMVCLLVCIFFVNIVVYMLQGKKEYKIDIERLLLFLGRGAGLLLMHQEVPPRGTGFQLLQLCQTATSHVLSAMYKCWKTNRGNLRTSVGNYEADDWYSIVTCI